MIPRSILLFSLVAVFISACASYKNVATKFPKNANEIILETLEQPLPPVYIGKQDSAENDGLYIWYEAIGNPADPAVLMVMGYNTSGIAWDNKFIEMLVNDGFFVIRYDNRDIGKSSYVSDWSVKDPYDLSDMARDGIAILDKLGIEKAHIAGISMGGMIGQTMALEHPDRVESLVSIATTAYLFDPEVISISPQVVAKFAVSTLKYGVATSGIYKEVKSDAEIVAFMQGKKQIDEELLRRVTQKTAQRIVNGHDPHSVASKQQMAAMRKSGSRLESLSSLDIPVLVIHGEIDPLIQAEHAYKYLKKLNNIQALFLPDCGHIPAPKHFEQMHEEVLCFIQKNCKPGNGFSKQN